MDALFPENLTACERHTWHLDKGSMLYHQGQFAREFYYLKNGLIGLWHMLENGKESLVRIYDSQHYFGYRTLFGGDNYHCTAKVLRAAEVIQIKPHNPQTFLSENPELSHVLIRRLAVELQDAEHRLSQISYQKTQERVAFTLDYLTRNYPHYHWTHREIAEFAGCETETAIRVAKKLREERE